MKSLVNSKSISFEDIAVAIEISVERKEPNWRIIAENICEVSFPAHVININSFTARESVTVGLFNNSLAREDEVRIDIEKPK